MPQGFRFPQTLCSSICALIFFGACGGNEDASFELLTYNIAALPEGFNDDQNPEQNVPLMGAKMAPYDLVLVQEDFAYSQALRTNLTQTQWSYSDPNEGLGDGLNQFGNLDFEPELYRETWEQCFGLFDSGSDCLTSKGFSHSVVTWGEVQMDVINFHMDAGQSDDDVSAREIQVAQVLAFTATLPNDRPLLMAGDTNLKIQGDLDESAKARNQAMLDALNERAEDVCGRLSCSAPAKIDRVYFRGVETLDLAPNAWRVDDTFVNDAGEPLSDHDAVAVSFGSSANL